LKLRIEFKDGTVTSKLIQGEDGEIKGIEVEAPIIDWPKKHQDGEYSVDGKNIIYLSKAGETCLCSECKKEKPREAFGKNRTTRNGLQSVCIRCRVEMARQKRVLELLQNEDE
jgi:hypothetical protein